MYFAVSSFSNALLGYMGMHFSKAIVVLSLCLWARVKCIIKKYKKICKYTFLSIFTILLDFSTCNGRGAWMMVLFVGK
jgi:hypothetical protein